MQHVKDSRWNDYIWDQLTDSERTELEDHLYACDQCLAAYMKALEQAEWTVQMREPEQWTEQLMKQISTQAEPAKAIAPLKENELIDNTQTAHAQHQQKSKRAVKGKRSIWQHSVFHYGVAAVITILMMSSGLFHSLAGTSFEVRAESMEPKAPVESVSQNLVDKLFYHIDQLVFETSDKKEENNE